MRKKLITLTMALMVGVTLAVRKMIKKKKTDNRDCYQTGNGIW